MSLVRYRPFIVGLIISCSVTVCNAQLVFEKPEQITKAKANQKDFTATYKFRNAGKSTITILKIKGSCACLATGLKKKVYKPGESGQFDAKLLFGAAVGKFVKSLYVYTDESSTKKYMVKIGAVIPTFATIVPRYVRWYKESKATTETIKVKVTYKDPIKVIKVESSNPDYKVKLVTVKEGREYDIQLAPPHTREPSRTALSIEMDYPADNHLLYRVVARVSHRVSPEKANKGWVKSVDK